MFNRGLDWKCFKKGALKRKGWRMVGVVTLKETIPIKYNEVFSTIEVFSKMRFSLLFLGGIEKEH